MQNQDTVPSTGISEAKEFLFTMTGWGSEDRPLTRP